MRIPFARHMMFEKKKQTLPASLPAVPTFGTVYARLTLPAEAAETLEDAVRLQAEAMSPFEEGAYTLGYEVLRRHGGGIDVLAAVASDAALADPWHAWLKERGLLGTLRLDLTGLGWIRGLLERRPALARGQHLAVLRVDSEQLILLLSEGSPLELRALPPEASDADFLREVTLVLAQAAMTGGGDLVSVVCFAKDASAAGPLRELLGGEPEFEPLEGDGAAEALLQRGLRLRAGEEGHTFDLTPQPWRDEARQARRRRLMTVGGAVAGVLWLLCAAVLFLLPRIYGHLAAVAGAQLAAHRQAYEEVLDLRGRVTLIERYQDRQHSALEMLRLLCVARADTMTFLSANYRQKQSLRLSGLADDTSDVYAFKEALQKDERIREVKITRLAQDGKTRRQRFDVDIAFATGEDNE